MERIESKDVPEEQPSGGQADRTDDAAAPEVMALEVPEPIGERLSTVDAITSGNLRQAVWGLAWPTLVANVLMTLTGVLNAFFVGQLGSKDAMAAVGWAEQILMVIFSVVMSVAVGTTALVARFVGARNLREAEQAARQSLLLGIVAAGVALVILGVSPVPLLRAMGAKGAILDLSARYIWITTLAMVPFFGVIVIGAVFRGLGDTLTPMRIMVGVNVIAVVLDYTLILGPGPFPQLGVIGAAISGDVARVAGFIASVWYLSRGPLKGALKGPMVPSWRWFMRILRIGTPTALQSFLRTGAGMTFVSVLGRLPDASSAVAALTIGMRTEAISFMPGLAFGMAAGSMVGQNLGARQPRRAEQSGWMCVWQAMTIMVPVAAGFYILARPLAGIFTRDPRVIALTVGYLRANAIGQPALAFGMVLSGALQGAGETKVPAWVTLASMWGVRLPAAYLIAVVMGLGASGAWWTMTASSVVYGVIIVALFRRGKWKSKQV